MNLKSTLTKLSLMVLFSFGITTSNAEVQVYCSPTFANGCSNWTNQSITLGTINWTNSDCTVSDNTSMSATLDAGVSTAMIVTSGVWCGCSVWIDFNNDNNFDSTENLYHHYTGGDPGYTYNFNITVPSNIPTGTYRMRVIAGWGSDGYSAGANGYGACGSYQYGNFDDFLVNVVNVVGVHELNNTKVSLVNIYPNPSKDNISIRFDESIKEPAELSIRNLLGEVVMTKNIFTEDQQVDLSFLSKGSYIIEVKSKDLMITQKLMKL